MAPLRTFEHAGLTFDVDDSGGTGEAVVLLHGYPGTKGSWDRVTPAFAGAGYRVLAFDQRGYSPGARPAGRRSYTLEHLVGDVLALAADAGLDRFHLVGHDWGGAVAWAAAAWHPERLLTMTSLATPHFRALLRSMLSSAQVVHSWFMLFCQLPWLPEKALTTGAGAKAFVRTLVKSGLAEERAHEYVRFMQAGAARPAINWYRAVPFDRPAPPVPVGVPVLYLHGTGDFALGRRAADLTGRYVRGQYRYEALEGVSHWIPEESADVAVPLVLEHLRAHPAPVPPPTQGEPPHGHRP